MGVFGVAEPVLDITHAEAFPIRRIRDADDRDDAGLRVLVDDRAPGIGDITAQRGHHPRVVGGS